MAQSACLLRFRARLRSRGYSDISIKRHHDPSGELSFDSHGWAIWYVTCTEPLLGYQAIFCVTEPQMDNWPGIAFQNCGFYALQMSLFESGKEPAGFFDDDNIPNQIYEGGDGLFV